MNITLISSLYIPVLMAINKSGLLGNNFAIASILFAILAILFVVFAVMKLNLCVDFALLVVMMMVGFFGILPHAFEEMK